MFIYIGPLKVPVFFIAFLTLSTFFCGNGEAATFDWLMVKLSVFKPGISDEGYYWMGLLSY